MKNANKDNKVIVDAMIAAVEADMMKAKKVGGEGPPSWFDRNRPGSAYRQNKALVREELLKFVSERKIVLSVFDKTKKIISKAEPTQQEKHTVTEDEIQLVSKQQYNMREALEVFTKERMTRQEGGYKNRLKMNHKDNDIQVDLRDGTVSAAKNAVQKNEFYKAHIEGISNTADRVKAAEFVSGLSETEAKNVKAFADQYMKIEGKKKLSKDFFDDKSTKNKMLRGAKDIPQTMIALTHTFQRFGKKVNTDTNLLSLAAALTKSTQAEFGKVGTKERSDWKEVQDIKFKAGIDNLMVKMDAMGIDPKIQAALLTDPENQKAVVNAINNPTMANAVLDNLANKDLKLKPEQVIKLFVAAASMDTPEQADLSAAAMAADIHTNNRDVVDKKTFFKDKARGQFVDGLVTQYEESYNKTNAYAADVDARKRADSIKNAPLPAPINEADRTKLEVELGVTIGGAPAVPSAGLPEPDAAELARLEEEGRKRAPSAGTREGTYQSLPVGPDDVQGEQTDQGHGDKGSSPKAPRGRHSQRVLDAQGSEQSQDRGGRGGNGDST